MASKCRSPKDVTIEQYAALAIAVCNSIMDTDATAEPDASNTIASPCRQSMAHTTITSTVPLICVIQFRTSRSMARSLSSAVSRHSSSRVPTMTIRPFGEVDWASSSHLHQTRTINSETGFQFRFHSQLSTATCIEQADIILKQASIPTSESQ